MDTTVIRKEERTDGFGGDQFASEDAAEYNGDDEDRPSSRSRRGSRPGCDRGRRRIATLCQMLDDKLGRAFCEFNIKFKRVCKEMRKMEIIIYTNFHSIIGIYITFDNGPVLDTVSESYLSFRRK